MAPRQAAAPVAAPTRTEAAAAAPRRMSMANVITQHAHGPMRLMVIGTEGVGKSTFAAQAPKPIFLTPEMGLEFLSPQPAAFPQPKTWQDILDAVQSLIREPHDFETLVIDTIDWVEQLVYDVIQGRTGMDAEKMDAYGRWVKVAMEDWRSLARGLEVLQEKRGMHVVILAHAGVETFKNPAGEDYQRFSPKLAGKSMGGPCSLWKEWCHAVLFATYELSFSGKKEGAMKKADATGNRLLYCTWTPAHDAKNRWGLPDSIALDWDELMAWKAKGSPAPAEALLADGFELLAQLDGDAGENARISQYLNDNAKDAGALARAVDKLRWMLSQKAKKEIGK